MKTELLKFDEQGLYRASKIIRNGGLVAFPTETVYGLGANALNYEAVANTFRAKGRPSDNPLIVHVWSKEQIYEIADSVNEMAEKVIDKLLPNSLTIVLPKKQGVVADNVSAGLSTVAIRMPLSEQARQFIRACGLPISAPSANTSTRPSPTSWQAVYEDMNGKIDAIMCGQQCDVGIESTVLDLSGETPRILRPGIVTPYEIEQVLGVTVQVITNPKEKVNSPGVRYKHYAPSCEMVLNTDGDCDKLCAFYDSESAKGKRAVLLVQDDKAFGQRNCYLLGSSDRQVAHNLFDALRTCEKKYDIIIASYTGKGQLADSILNRMTKSCGGRML